MRGLKHDRAQDYVSRFWAHAVHPRSVLEGDSREIDRMEGYASLCR